MKTQTIIACATAVLSSGAVAASAETVQPKASDTLNLSATQQKTAWNDLDHAKNQNGPSGFNAAAGSKLLINDVLQYLGTHETPKESLHPAIPQVSEEPQTRSLRAACSGQLTVNSCLWRTGLSRLNPAFQITIREFAQELVNAERDGCFAVPFL